MRYSARPGVLAIQASFVSHGWRTHTAEERQESVENLSASFVISGSFSIDDGDGNYNARNKQFDWSSEENKRVVRTYEQVRAILCKTTTWNYNVYRFDDNLGIQLYSFNSLYLISRRAHTNSVISYFAKIIEHEQDGTITNRHN